MHEPVQCLVNKEVLAIHPATPLDVLPAPSGMETSSKNPRTLILCVLKQKGVHGHELVRSIAGDC